MLLEALSVRTQQNSASRGRQLASMALIQRNLATLYLDTDREEDAERAYLQALANLREPGRAPFSERAPILVEILLDLSRLYLKATRFEEAKPLTIEAVEVSRELCEMSPQQHSNRLAWALVQDALMTYGNEGFQDCAKVEEALNITTDRDMSSYASDLLASCHSEQLR